MGMMRGDLVPQDNLHFDDGDVVGHWRVRALIGSGGFGKVYRVEHTRSGAIGALKLLSRFDDESRLRFELETEILQTIHASTKPAKKYFPAYLESGVYACGEHAVPYVVTEFLAPFRLQDGNKEIGVFALQICEAVEELHRNGYIHRDIKTQNIMMRELEGAPAIPVLIDFGGAIRIKDAVSEDVRHRISMEYGQIKGFGTLYSSAPEQAYGVASIQSDVYAIGALIDECFKGGTPKHWSKILQKATSPKPENRYSNVAQLRNAILGIPATGRGFWIGCVSCILLTSLILGVMTILRGPKVRHTDIELKEPTVLKERHELGEGRCIKINDDVEMELVWCSAGSFDMGSPETEIGRNSNEKLHSVRISKGFWIGKYPVTQDQWESVMGSNPSFFKGGRLPVERVSWYECVEFTQKLSSLVKEDVSLPTEAQWEYACRSGCQSAYYWGSNDLNGDKANCDGTIPNGAEGVQKGPNRMHTSEVGSYPPNAWGLFDMSGNVYEWCMDWYGLYDDKGVDPKGPRFGASKIYRGGNWCNGARFCRSAARAYNTPDFKSSRCGLRIVITED